MNKLKRKISPEKGKIIVRFGIFELKNNEPELWFFCGDGTSKSDVRLLNSILSDNKIPGTDKSLLQELSDRGYDLSTLKIEISKFRTAGGEE